MVALGRAVRSAAISGRREIAKPMRKTQSIGQDIEGWNMVNEVQIPGNEFGPKMAFLDTLDLV